MHWTRFHKKKNFCKIKSMRYLTLYIATVNTNSLVSHESVAASDNNDPLSIISSNSINRIGYMYNT